MPASDTRFELQQLVARYANSFDLKDWGSLGRCLASRLYTDYSDLRGTPPEAMTREKFVELRRSALHDIQTHHLSGNVEVNLDGNAASLKVSMIIFRRNDAGETLNTHCCYFFQAEQENGDWVLSSITQKVFINDGQSAVHKGIITDARPTAGDGKSEQMIE